MSKARGLADLANRHYAEILKQVEAGTLTIADAETPEL